jgi:hypothetical protein
MRICDVLCWIEMLRPTAGLLGSSRAARRANVRAERVKALGHAARGIRALVTVLVALAIDLVLLWALPFVYMVSAYLALDLPARWIAHRDAWGGRGVIIFLAALVVGLIGVARAVQNAAPIAPVRPQFAKAMLAVSWVAALLMTIGDLVF